MSNVTFDPNQPAYSEAYQQVRPELEAMSEQDTEAIRHDIIAVSYTHLQQLTPRPHRRARYLRRGTVTHGMASYLSM